MRPDYPNATYRGDVKITIHNRQYVSLYGVLGRAWKCNEWDDPIMISDRWYFEPILSPPDHSDANTYIVFEGSLEFL